MDTHKDLPPLPTKPVEAAEVRGSELCCGDLLALCSYLAQYQYELNDLRYKILALADADAGKAILIMQWPVIQTTRAQTALKRIGEIPHETAAVNRAVAAILANPAYQPVGGEASIETKSNERKP